MFHFDARKCQPFNGKETEDEKETIKNIRNIMVQLLPSIGVADITEKNWTEIYARLKICEKLSGGAFMNVFREDGTVEERLFTPLDVKRWIGQSPTGISWSTSRNVARKFAFGAGIRVSLPSGFIFSGYADERDVLGYMTDRGESEIIVDPRKVKSIEVVTVAQ